MGSAKDDLAVRERWRWVKYKEEVLFMSETLARMTIRRMSLQITAMQSYVLSGTVLPIIVDTF